MLLNISPIDGRYKEMTQEIKSYFSEYYLMKNRVIVEIEWLKELFRIKEFGLEISKKELEVLEKIAKEFDISEAKRIKEIESITKHDVKAVEYYINEKLKQNHMEKYNYLVHFACTSEDINNIAYGIMEKELLEKVYLPNVTNLVELLEEKANLYATTAMISHTHGQSATPTTVGKELSVFVYRISRFLNRLKQEKITGKFNGTVGNFNSHFISYPNVDWLKIAKEFVEGFGLEYNMYTTQIEPHDTICAIFSEMKLLNNVVLDFSSDMWMYISRNYFIQKNVKGEVGSSVMPHKINPIHFENAMANIKMANGIIQIFIDNLPISRMQRDLSDSSMLRNIGSMVAYSVIAVKQCITGLNKLEVNKNKLMQELQNTPEVLAEAMQTILRKNKVENAYEILKHLTRGKQISLQEMRKFIQKLSIDENDKQVLLELTPQNYIGLASSLAKSVKKKI
ncbi:MAG: adenylosuccinate lyase [Clostridia bacterium]|nr:adenylosuccinate lyase [Clostridia bacterium]